MGINYPSTSKIELSYYSRQVHSVQGAVSVYRLKGQALYLFQKCDTSAELGKLAKQISSLRSNSLCSYFGNLLANHQVQVRHQCLCSSQEQINSSSFWSFQNYTLAQQTIKNQHQRLYPPEQKIWTLLSSLAEASSILMDSGLYVDCTLQNVYLSPLRNYQLYWGHAKIGNSHRLYYKALMGQKVADKMAMSPEELKGMRQGYSWHNVSKLIARLDLQKCVIYSIGVVALLYANSISDYSVLYDQKNHQTSSQALANLIRQGRTHLSDTLTSLLLQMTQQAIPQRYNLKMLLESININVQHTMVGYASPKFQNQMDTCVSSKVTVKNLRL